jgi:hypothetical protein
MADTRSVRRTENPRVGGSISPLAIYTRLSANEYHEVLELDADGKGFKPYVTNQFLKVEEKPGF